VQPSIFYLILIQGKCSHQFSQKEKEGGGRIFSKSNRPQQKQTLNPNKRGKRRKNKAIKPKPKSIQNAASFLFFPPPFACLDCDSNKPMNLHGHQKKKNFTNMQSPGASFHQIAFGFTSTPLVREYG
jgi:hypothetical protein